MRISTETMSNMSVNSMQGAYRNYADILTKIAARKNFTKVSENVPDSVNVLKIKKQLANLEDYQGNIQHAINEMNMAYDTLVSVNDELSNINNLVIQASDGSTTPDSAKAIAVEISQRVATIKDLMNTKYLDNYIFSGTNVKDVTYETDADGNVTYNGSSAKSGDRNVTISQNTKFSYNFTGEEIFGEQDGVNDFFSQMNALDELLSNPEDGSLDFDKIREKITTVQKAASNISQKNGVISAKVSKLTATQEINNSTINSLIEKRSDVEDLDIVKAASDLANANTAMQASYLLGANVLSSVSLLDYI